MRIQLINCDAKLKAMGIYMESIGSYDKLCIEIAKKLTYTTLEYVYPPFDIIIINMEGSTDNLDLSDYGELVQDDSYTR